MPSFGACWKLGSLGQGCSATCGGAQFTDPALTVALGSSSVLVEALCEHEYLEPPNRHAGAFDRTCEPPANSRFFTARFLYFPEVLSWDCFPGESIEDIAPVFRSPCACTEPLPYAEWSGPQLCASNGCAALSSLAVGFCLALCLAWCFLCFCRRRQPSYHGDYGDHGGGPKGEGNYAGGEIYGYSSRSYRGSGGFDENYGVNDPLGCIGSLGCLRLQIRLQYCWREVSYQARRGCSCWSLQFRLQRYWNELVYQAGRCYRGCCHYVGGLSPYGYRPSSYYGDQMDERWRGTLSSPRGGTHRRSPSAYSGSHASTPRYEGYLRSPRRPEPHAGGQPFSAAEVREAFARFDANRSGKLDHTELRSALRTFGLDVDSGQATAILQQYDNDGNGLLDVDEFGRLVGRLYELHGLDRSRATPSTTAHAAASPIAAIAAAGPMASGSAARRWSDSEVRAAFDRFDANRSGRLDYSELRAALRALAGLELDSQEATAVLQQYDADGNGLLDVDEFGSLVRRLSGLGSLSTAAKTPGHAVRSTPSTPPRVAWTGWTGREARSLPDLDAGGSTLRSFEERPRERPREHNTCARPYNAFRDRQPTMQSVGGGTIWGGSGPPPPGKQKAPQQTFFPPATRAPSGYSNAQREQMSMH